MAGTGILVGPQIGVTDGRVSGSTFYSPSGGEYTSKTNVGFIAEERLQIPTSLLFSYITDTNGFDTGLAITSTTSDPFAAIAHSSVFFTAGIEVEKTKVTATGPGFDSTNGVNMTSFTGSAGITIPIFPQVDIVAQYRLVAGGQGQALVPGRVGETFWGQAVNVGVELHN